jgi:pimeloyl-ACP methyl ester carboxylesterase
MDLKAQYGFFILIALSVLLVSLTGCTGLSDAAAGKEKASGHGTLVEVERQPELGFSWPYLLYLPQKTAPEPLPVILIANNTPRPADDYAVHYRQARRKVEQYRQLADRTGLPLLLAAIPRFRQEFPGGSASQRDAWVVGVQSLNRNALLTPVPALKRMDLQAAAMLEHAGNELKERGLAVTGKAIVFGFSASGTFAHRFALLHPELVCAEVAGAPGGWYTLPMDSYRGKMLRYPVGTADVRKLTGKDFALEQYRRISKLFFVGEEDQDDAVPYLDAYAYEDRLTIMELFGADHMERYRQTGRLFTRQEMNARMRFIEDTGHEISATAWRLVYSFIGTHCSALPQTAP